MNNGVPPSGFTKLNATQGITSPQISAVAPRDTNGVLTAYNIGVVVPVLSEAEITAVSDGTEANNPVASLFFNSDADSFVGIAPDGSIEPFGGNPGSNVYGGVSMQVAGDPQVFGAPNTPAQLTSVNATWAAGPLAGYTARDANTTLRGSFAGVVPQAVTVHLTVSSSVAETQLTVFVYGGGDPLVAATTLLAAQNAPYTINLSKLFNNAPGDDNNIWLSVDKIANITVTQGSMTFVGA